MCPRTAEKAGGGLVNASPDDLVSVENQNRIGLWESLQRNLRTWLVGEDRVVR